MKILSWNCNGAFRKKYHLFKNLDIDIFVIQECENPKLTDNDEYKKFANNYEWIGENKNKGLGIFAKKDIKLSKNNWNSYCLRYFLPIRVNDKYNLLGVWACSPYIEEYYIYQSINIEKYDKNTIIIGDFNSNAIWDSKHGTRNHTNVVNELKNISLESAYHYYNNCKHGKEKDFTFYLYRHKDKPFHIDYCFANTQLLKNFSILDDEFIKYSDHLPFVVEI